MKIPDPPDDLSEPDRQFWLRNADLLKQYQNAHGELRYPAWVVERFCRQVVHAKWEDVEGLLRDFREEGKTHQ